MSRTMGSGRMTNRDDLLPKHGKIFNPPTIEKMLDLCLENGRFASFSTSMKTLRKNQKNNPSGMIIRQTPPVNYFGSGILDDPCDLCVIPERNIMLVTCVNGGIYSFVIDEAAEKRAETGKVSRTGATDSNVYLLQDCLKR
uniref:Uncharacterized protein n=1 Tax=Romanomermis culicivorax TaxID=13658 RepID=A0A915HKS5_ROMCU